MGTKGMDQDLDFEEIKDLFAFHQRVVNKGRFIAEALSNHQ